MPTEDLLRERQKTHGDFSKNAFISQVIKEILHSEEGWKTLSFVQRETIDMICLKISRIMSGQGSFIDHWEDISGYVMLAVKELTHGR